MRSRALAAFCLVAGAACSGSSGSGADGADAFTGDWVGQGLFVWTWAAPTDAPTAPGEGATRPWLVSFQALTFVDASGGVGIAGVILPFPDVVPMQLDAGGAFRTSPFKVSRPAPEACADTPCQEQTDVLTVTGALAHVLDGDLRVALTGERVLCCQRATFTVTFVGTRAGQAW